MVEPPSSTGAVHVTTADALPADADTLAGEVAAVGAGVTALDSADGVPAPAALVAAMVNVYVVPFVKPVIGWAVAVDANGSDVCARPPMNGVTT